MATRHHVARGRISRAMHVQGGALHADQAAEELQCPLLPRSTTTGRHQCPVRVARPLQRPDWDQSQAVLFASGGAERADDANCFHEDSV